MDDSDASSILHLIRDFLNRRPDGAFASKPRIVESSNRRVKTRRRDAPESRPNATARRSRSSRVETPRGVKRAAFKRAEGVGIDDVTASIH